MYAVLLVGLERRRMVVDRMLWNVVPVLFLESP